MYSIRSNGFGISTTLRAGMFGDIVPERAIKQFLKIQVSDISFLNESINIPHRLFNII